MSLFDMYKNEAYNKDNDTSDIINEDGEVVLNPNEIAGAELFSVEALNEASLFESQHYKYCLHIDPDQNRPDGFLNDPYVKIYDGQSYSKSKNCIRVHLKDGKCEHHIDNKGGLPFSDKDWKEFLDDVIDKPSTNRMYSNLTVFQACFKVMQNVYNITDKDMEQYKFPHITYKTGCYWGGKNVKPERKIITGKH